jgi:hypothetical protein
MLHVILLCLILIALFFMSHLATKIVIKIYDLFKEKTQKNIRSLQWEIFGFLVCSTILLQGLFRVLFYFQALHL